MLYSHRGMGPPQNIGKNEDMINNFGVAWTVHKQVDRIHRPGIRSPKKDENKLIVMEETFFSDFRNSILYVVAVNERYHLGVTRIQCVCMCVCVRVCMECRFIHLKRVNKIQGCSLEGYVRVRLWWSQWLWNML